MSCADLATKADITALNSKLDQIIGSLSDLATKSDIAKIETKLNLMDNKLDLLLSRDVASSQQVDNIWGFLNGLIDAIVRPIETAILTLGNTVEAIIFSIRDVIIQALNGLENVITTAITSSERVLHNAIDSVENVITTAITSSERVLHNAIDSVENAIITALNQGFGVLNNAIDSVESILNNLIDSLEGIVNRIVDSITNVIRDSINLLKTFIQEFFESLRTVVEQMVSVINTIINNLDMILELVRPLLEAINAIRIAIIEAIQALLQAFLDQFRYELEAADGILGTLNQINGKLGSFPAGCNLNTPIGSVAQGLQMLICGFNNGDGNTLSQAELMAMLNQIMALLAQITGDSDDENDPESLKGKIEEILKRLGADQYPVNVPVSLTGRDLATTQIQSLTEFQSWQTKQLYNMVGRFPINIKIEDTDLIKTGNQSADLEFENLSETLAEMMYLLIEGRSKNDALLNITLKNLIETGSTKKQAITSYRLLQAIQSYLGFKTKQKTEQVRLTFNPLVGSDGASESLSRALQNSEVTIKIEEEDEDHTLEEKLLTLLEGARIIKGRFWEKLTPQDVGKWVQNIKDLAGAIDGTSSGGTGELSDFDSYLEQVERGFTDVSGNSETIYPYGREYDQRPRIRELGNQLEGEDS
jgi:hypothetical protein